MSRYDVMFVKCRCLFTSVKLCLICNLQKKNCNLQNIYLVFCSCLLVVCGHFVVVCGCLLMVWRHLVVVCRCLLVDCGSLWLFTGGLWLFADSLGLFGGGLWSFVLACGLRLLPVLVITYIYRSNNVIDMVNRFHFEMVICFMGIELF